MIRPERLQPTHMVDAVDANEFEMTVVDTINYGDSILVIGTTRGVPLRARLVGTRPDMLRPGADRYARLGAGRCARPRPAVR